MRQFYSFGMSGEYTGKRDSFGRSEWARYKKNRLTEHDEHMRQFYSFGRSEEYTGNEDSFQRSNAGFLQGKRIDH